MKSFLKLNIMIALLWLLLAGTTFGQDSSDDYIIDETEVDMDELMDELDVDPEESSSSKAPEKELDFRLSLLGENGFYFRMPVIPDHFDFQGNIKAPRFKNDLGIELEYKFLKLVSHWQVDGVVSQTGRIEDILQVRPLENSLALSPWKFNIEMGYLYHTWGTADKFNPTDNLNPVDYSLGIDKEKLAVLSAKVEFFPVDFLSLEAVYIPFLANNIYPFDYTAELKERLQTDNVTLKEAAFDPKTFSLGGKVNFYLQYADFSFSYLYGMDRYLTPEFTLTPVTAGPATLFYNVGSLELKRKRVHHFGADFKTNVDRFGIWAELCYTMSEDYLMNRDDLKNHKLAWTTGFDFNYGPDDKFYMNFQYFGTYVPGYYSSLSNDYKETTLGGQELPYETMKEKSYYESYYNRALTEYLGGNTSGLEMGLAFNMKFPFDVGHLSFEPSLTASYMIPIIYDRDARINYGSLFIKPEFIFSPLDALDIVIGADLYYSWKSKKGSSQVEIDDESLMGMFHKDSNIYFAVNYRWSFDFYK